MIRFAALSKFFDTPDGSVVAADQITLEVPEGHICVLLGPSGCGKTTLLRMVNRLVEPSAGTVFLEERDVRNLDPVPLRRNIGYVIQQAGLFPHLTVEANIGVVPGLLGWDSRRIRRRAEALLEMVALDPALFLRRYPRQLSTGQQQRVGLARALAADPPVLLMDEPFGDIDPLNRISLQDQFLAMQRELGKTVLFVSHDVDEAIKVADRIAILRKGRLEQYDAPDSLLAHPANGFVAEFVGADRTLKRLQLVRVAQAMDPGAPRVRSEDTLERAAELMAEHGYDHIVFVGPRGRARGSLSLALARAERGTCGEFRTTLKTTVNVHDDLRTAVSLMFTHAVTWLACVDDDGFFKGFLTQRRITQVLSEVYQDPG